MESRQEWSFVLDARQSAANAAPQSDKSSTHACMGQLINQPVAPPGNFATWLEFEEYEAQLEKQDGEKRLQQHRRAVHQAAVNRKKELRSWRWGIFCQVLLGIAGMIIMSPLLKAAGPNFLVPKPLPDLDGMSQAELMEWWPVPYTGPKPTLGGGSCPSIPAVLLEPISPATKEEEVCPIDAVESQYSSREDHVPGGATAPSSGQDSCEALATVHCEQCTPTTATSEYISPCPAHWSGAGVAAACVVAAFAGALVSLAALSLTRPSQHMGGRRKENMELQISRELQGQHGFKMHGQGGEMQSVQ